MADAEEKRPSDKRTEWLRARLISSLKAKDAVLDRLFAHEDSGAIIASFLDTSETNRLLIYDAGKGELAAVRAPVNIQPRAPPRAARGPAGAPLRPPHARWAAAGRRGARGAGGQRPRARQCARVAFGCGAQPC
jgi:hypothetical protein